MDFFSDLIGSLGMLSFYYDPKYNPKRAGKVADALWSPLGLLLLATFAVLSVAVCVSTPHR